jgi:hypothetical protein
MKTNLLKAFAMAIAIISLHNCSVEPAEDFSLTIDSIILEADVQSTETQAAQAAVCAGANPKARVANNGTLAFDYEIYDSSGVLIAGIYNIMPGTITDWTDFPEGTIIFNLENGIERDQKVAHLMENCTEINMEIDSSNLLTTAMPQPVSD